MLEPKNSEEIEELTRAFQPTLWLKAPVISSISSDSFGSWNVYRHESGRCCSLPFILTIFLISCLTRFRWDQNVYHFFLSRHLELPIICFFLYFWKCRLCHKICRFWKIHINSMRCWLVYEHPYKISNYLQPIHLNLAWTYTLDHYLILSLNERTYIKKSRIQLATQEKCSC